MERLERLPLGPATRTFFTSSRGSVNTTLSLMPSSDRTLAAPSSLRRATSCSTSTSGAEAPAVIMKILTHLGLPARAPSRARAQRLDLFEAA